ncbi:MAG TPA: carbohydrate ABC transporter permease [Devosia sp.]|nr:carbohydrate ABC transporter permease [Devosia sp.]
MIVGKTAQSAGFRRTRWLLTAVLALYFVYTFIPILYVITASTKTNPDLFGTFGLWFSSDFHLWQNLHDLFAQDRGAFGRWLWNSFYYAILSGVGAALVCTIAGYAFSKYEFAGKRFLYALVLGAVMIPQTALVIPLFLLLSQIKLLDTPWAVILPQLVFPQGVFLMRAYIDDAVSNEIIDAGRVDGAGEFRIFSTLAFRLLMPAVSTVFVLAFVASWNNYFLPLVVLNSSEHFPLTVGLANWYASAAGGSGGSLLYTIVMAGALVSIVPVIVAFLFIQRFWQGGLATGSVKA